MYLAAAKRRWCCRSSLRSRRNEHLWLSSTNIRHEYEYIIGSARSDVEISSISDHSPTSHLVRSTRTAPLVRGRSWMKCRCLKPSANLLECGRYALSGQSYPSELGNGISSTLPGSDIQGRLFESTRSKEYRRRQAEDVSVRATMGHGNSNRYDRLIALEPYRHSASGRNKLPTYLPTYTGQSPPTSSSTDRSFAPR